MRLQTHSAELVVKGKRNETRRRSAPNRLFRPDYCLSFIRAGVPGFNTLQDYVDYDVRTHHTNTDFYERLREEDLKQNAVVLATFLYHAAMRDEKIPRN